MSNINEHRSSRVCPSELICVDESMCKWYGQGGNWIRKGLPMYVAIDRKPENGCEIQNAACGRSGIMLRLSVVTSTEHRQETAAGDNDGQPHGTAVIKNLVAPWAGTTLVVCADSYFASVATAQQLLGMGLRFIGVVKTATRGFPMASMSTAPLGARGEHFSYKYTSADGVTDLMAVVWVDRERRYFIASASSTIPGKPYTRLRWRQGDESAARVTLTVPQPQVAETYYCCCSQIDRHNRCRQDDLRLEHKLVTHDWSMRVNLSLLGMCIVDSLLLYSGARGAAAGHNQNKFYEDLAEQLIENTFETVGMRPRGDAGATAGEVEPVPLRYGVGIHLTPTRKRRTGSSTKDGEHRAQRTCRVCHLPGTSWVCSGCRDSECVEVFCCGPRTGRSCFDKHMREVHKLDV